MKPTPPDVADQGRLIRRVDITTQPAHVNVDQVRIRNKFVVPDIFQEGGSCQQFAAPPHHVLEQLEFPCPQIDPTVATRRDSIDEVEFKRSYSQHRFIRRSGPPDGGGSARYQFNDCERLSFGIVAAQGRSAHPVHDLLKCARQQRMKICTSSDGSGSQFRGNVLDEEAHQNGQAIDIGQNLRRFTSHH